MHIYVHVMKKVWRPVVGHEAKYIVSDHGDVTTLSRVVTSGRYGGTRTTKTKPLTIWLDKNGYKRATICGKSTTVHRLVALAFIDKPDGSDWVNHKDGDKLNSHVSNLEWCTPLENARHARDVLGRNVGERCRQHKLTERMVRRARELRRQGVIYDQLAKRFRVGRTAIWHALNGVSWKHVTKRSPQPSSCP